MSIIVSVSSITNGTLDLSIILDENGQKFLDFENNIIGAEEVNR